MWSMVFTQTMVKRKFKYYETYLTSILVPDRYVKLIHIKKYISFKNLRSLSKYSFSKQAIPIKIYTVTNILTYQMKT